MLLQDSIKKAQNIILSTHKNSDGDGLGCEIAMYFALIQINKKPYFFHSDLVPDRYHFLTENIPAEAFLTEADLEQKEFDLVLIFDTHDPKLCSPLYENLTIKNKPVFFIDHHVRTDYNTKAAHTFIDETASCTGEIVFNLLKSLTVELDKNIASSLYASLIFDTQNFRFIRDPSKPFLMASELLSVGFNHEKIQNKIFANWNIAKMNYLSYLIPKVTYLKNNSVAIIKIFKSELKKFSVEADQISDLVDLFMSIDSVDIAIVIREESISYHKLSFRSRSHIEILSWARSFNGGGHSCSAGAWVEKTMPEIEVRIHALIDQKIWKKNA
ncbi:MAG: DHH family phosphoesterase [Pseudobdellovibrio sp.]